MEKVRDLNMSGQGLTLESHELGDQEETRSGAKIRGPDWNHELGSQ